MKFEIACAETKSGSQAVDSTGVTIDWPRVLNVDGHASYRQRDIAAAGYLRQTHFSTQTPPEESSRIVRIPL